MKNKLLLQDSYARETRWKFVGAKPKTRAGHPSVADNHRMCEIHLLF